MISSNIGLFLQCYSRCHFWNWRFLAYFCSEIQNLRNIKQIQALIFNFFDFWLVFAVILKIFEISSKIKLSFLSLTIFGLFLQWDSKSSKYQANSSSHFLNLTNFGWHFSVIFLRFPINCFCGHFSLRVTFLFFSHESSDFWNSSFFLYFSRFYRCGWVWMGFWWKNEFFCHFFCVFGHFFVDFRRTTCLHLIAFWSALICLIFPRVPTFLWLCSKSVKLSWNDFFKRLFVAFLSFYNLQNSTLRVVLSRRREKLWVY